MHPKIVFFDFDGTLRDTRTNEISESNLLLLQKLREKGIKVVLITGRTKHILKFPKLDYTMFDAIVCNNGAVAYTNQFELIYAKTLPHEEVVKFIEYCKLHRVSLTIQCLEESFVVNGYNFKLLDSFQNYFADPRLPKEKQFNNEAVISMNGFCDDENFWHTTQQLFDFRFIIGAQTHVDILGKNLNKFEGVQSILKYFGLENEEYVCFGDQVNDMEMIAKAPIGISVQDIHSYPLLHEVSKYTCASGSENGLYNISKQLGIID